MTPEKRPHKVLTTAKVLTDPGSATVRELFHAIQTIITVAALIWGAAVFKTSLNDQAQAASLAVAQQTAALQKHEADVLAYEEKQRAVNENFVQQMVALTVSVSTIAEQLRGDRRDIDVLRGKR